MMSVPLAGVIGWPVAQSKSPAIHGTWLARHRIGGYYVPLAVRPDDLSEALRALPKLGFVGANVTLPHKIAALDLADTISETARRAGAANTLTFDGRGRIHADNTDGFGFVENLRQNAPGWRPDAGPALVLGAGGAARAIVLALLDAGVPEIAITNRTCAKSQALAETFGPRLRVLDWERRGDAVPSARLIVNTTSLGMTGQARLDLSLEGAHADALVTDIVYAPLQTELLAEAARRGLTTVDGLGMLLHQAVPGFERWFGLRPVVDAEIRAAALS